VAIDPTTPVTPIIPALPAGAASDSVAVIQALARQAQANATAPLGEIAGRASASPSKACAPVEQAGQAATQDAGHAADAPSAKAASAAAQALAKASPETRLARAVRVAATEAVPRQTGLAGHSGLEKHSRTLHSLAQALGRGDLGGPRRLG
jgi:hypothetical protein